MVDKFDNNEKNEEMSPAQKKIYDFVVEYILDHKYPPSIREICDGVGFKSTSSVHHYLNQMLLQGILETDMGFNCPRAIRVPELMIMRRKDGERVDHRAVEGRKT